MGSIFPKRHFHMIIIFGIVQGHLIFRIIMKSLTFSSVLIIMSINGMTKLNSPQFFTHCYINEEIIRIIQIIKRKLLRFFALLNSDPNKISRFIYNFLSLIHLD